MPRLLAVLATAACVGATAGCFATADAPTASDAQLAVAHKRAVLWADDARLVSIVGLEGPVAPIAVTLLSLGNGEAVLAEAAADDQVGDGHARVWAYGYESPNLGQTLVVAVNGEGDVLGTTTRGETTTQATLQGWRIDSASALEIAASSNPGVQSAASLEGSTVVARLRVDSEGRSVWTIAATTPDAAAPAIVRIDAMTGQAIATAPTSSA